MVVFIPVLLVSAATHAWAETRVLARANVPNAVLKQGEVRVVVRDGETIVQTILHTRYQRLVRNRIERNETKNWPDRPEAAVYMAALEQALEHYALKKRESAEPVGLVIDFVDGPESDRVDFRVVSVGRGTDGYTVDQGELWRSLRFPQDYIRRNQEHIVEDVFGREATVVLDVLQRARSSRLDETDD
jgi:hypothetical protein